MQLKFVKLFSKPSCLKSLKHRLKSSEMYYYIFQNERGVIVNGLVIIFNTCSVTGGIIVLKKKKEYRKAIIICVVNCISSTDEV